MGHERRKRILRLIAKWLKVGITEDGRVTRSERGAPQGAIEASLVVRIPRLVPFDAAVRASENAGEAQLPTLQCLLLRGEDRLPDHTVDTLGAVDRLGDMMIDAALCGGIT
jgi:hypothetical protein